MKAVAIYEPRRRNSQPGSLPSKGELFCSVPQRAATVVAVELDFDISDNHKDRISKEEEAKPTAIRDASQETSSPSCSSEKDSSCTVTEAGPEAPAGSPTTTREDARYKGLNQFVLLKQSTQLAKRRTQLKAQLINKKSDL